MQCFWLWSWCVFSTNTLTSNRRGSSLQHHIFTARIKLYLKDSNKTQSTDIKKKKKKKPLAPAEIPHKILHALNFLKERQLILLKIYVFKTSRPIQLTFQIY